MSTHSDTVAEPRAATLSEPELLRSFAAGRDLPCPACGYNLRDLVGRVCPECSTPVVLRLTAADPLWRLRWVAAVAFGASVCVSGAGVVMNVLAVAEYRGMLPPGYIALYSLGALINGAVLLGTAWGLLMMVRRWRAGGPDAQPVARAMAYGLWLVLVSGLLELGLSLAFYLVR